jgi:hypothetical protein
MQFAGIIAMKKPITGILIASACLTLACICCPANLFPFPSITQTITAIPPTATLFPTVTPIPEPSATPAPCLDASCVTACASQLDEILQTSEGDISPMKTFTGNTNSEGTDYELVDYGVNGDSLSAPDFLSVPDDLVAFQQDTATQSDIWKLFTTMIPVSQREMVNKYIIFTDGSYELLAAVEQQDNPKDWSLQVDIVDAKDRLALSGTLLHEFGHLLTLNTSQVEDATYVCATDYVNPGCGKTGSYMDLFFQRFWSDIYEEWDIIQSIRDPDTQAKRMRNFYVSHQHEFLTEYSATEPAEDIAEAWMFFILTPQPTGDTSTAEEKILFFYDFPELVQLRAEITARLCGYFLEP